MVASVGLLIFGVATFFDAFFAMDCSPTLSASCKVLEETGQLSAAHYAHTFTSVGAQIGIVASMVATYIAMVRSPRQSRTRRRVVLIISAFEVVALTVMMVMLAARPARPRLPAGGDGGGRIRLVCRDRLPAGGGPRVAGRDRQRDGATDVSLAGLHDER